MEQFLISLEYAVKNKNWYAALFVALALPDICGRLENPNANVGKRYRSWFSTYIEPMYTRKQGKNQEPHIMLSASDCYALRCAYLHEGVDDITNQKAREVIERFHFIEPPTNNILHRNLSDQTLQLQIDIFCHEMICGVRHWMKDKENDDEIANRIESMLKIYSVRRIQL